MFTGIIRHVGQVIDTRPSQSGRKITIDIGPLAEGLALGDSVAVNGLCLSATTVSGCKAEFDIIAESLSRSTLGNLRAGSKVNLERALPAHGRLDGHVVQGHVDGLATVKNIQKGDQRTITFSAERSLVDQMVPKGSIAINGVSLTLVDAAGENFSVAIIPTTLADTTLPNLSVGDQVNIEADILGKYVRRYLQTLLESSTGSHIPGGATPANSASSAAASDKNSPAGSGLTLDKLRNAGFM